MTTSHLEYSTCVHCPAQEWECSSRTVSHSDTGVLAIAPLREERCETDRLILGPLLISWTDTESQRQCTSKLERRSKTSRGRLELEVQSTVYKRDEKRELATARRHNG